MRSHGFDDGERWAGGGRGETVWLPCRHALATPLGLAAGLLAGTAQVTEGGASLYVPSLPGHVTFNRWIGDVYGVLSYLDPAAGLDISGAIGLFTLSLPPGGRAPPSAPSPVTAKH